MLIYKITYIEFFPLNVHLAKYIVVGASAKQQVVVACYISSESIEKSVGEKCSGEVFAFPYTCSLK